MFCSEVEQRPAAIRNWKREPIWQQNLKWKTYATHYTCRETVQCCNVVLLVVPQGNLSPKQLFTYPFLTVEISADATDIQQDYLLNEGFVLQASTANWFQLPIRHPTKHRRQPIPPRPAVKWSDRRQMLTRKRGLSRWNWIQHFKLERTETMLEESSTLLHKLASSTGIEPVLPTFTNAQGVFIPLPRIQSTKLWASATRMDLSVCSSTEASPCSCKPRQHKRKKKAATNWKGGRFPSDWRMWNHDQLQPQAMERLQPRLPSYGALGTTVCASNIHQ